MLDRLTAVVLSGIVVLGFAFAPVAAAGSGKVVYGQGDAERVAARITYRYDPDSLFVVNTAVGYVTDLELRKGETVRYVAAGDTVRWLIDRSVVDGVPHMYVKPLAGDISTNMIINTDRHSYRLLVQSVGGEEYDPLVAWRFDDTDAVPVAASGKNDFLLPLHFNYAYRFKRVGKKVPKDMLPVLVGDDGTRTYIAMPISNTYDAPVIYDVNDMVKKKDALTLVNFRAKHISGHLVFICDKVFRHARLQYGKDVAVDILEEKKNEK